MSCSTSLPFVTKRAFRQFVSEIGTLTPSSSELTDQHQKGKCVVHSCRSHHTARKYPRRLSEFFTQMHRAVASLRSKVSAQMGNGRKA